LSVTKLVDFPTWFLSTKLSFLQLIIWFSCITDLAISPWWPQPVHGTSKQFSNTSIFPQCENSTIQSIHFPASTKTKNSTHFCLFLQTTKPDQGHRNSTDFSRKYIRFPTTTYNKDSPFAKALQPSDSTDQQSDIFIHQKLLWSTIIPTSSRQPTTFWTIWTPNHHFNTRNNPHFEIFPGVDIHLIIEIQWPFALKIYSSFGKADITLFFQESNSLQFQLRFFRNKPF